MKNLEQYFNSVEIATIKKFVAFVADENAESKESGFSIGETDDEIRKDVKDWLEMRYRQGHRANRFKREL